MRSSSGFTLIELLVSVALASVVMVSLLGFFIAFINQQIRAQEERAALEMVRFLFTDLSREIYFGKDYVCGDGTDEECSCLIFSDQLGRRVNVRYNSMEQQMDRAIQSFDLGSSSCSPHERWIPLTVDTVAVTDFSFAILDVAGTAQPRIQMSITARYALGEETKDISFKTQVVSRIIEPNEDILLTFSVDPDTDYSGSSAHYFVFGPRVNGEGDFIDECGVALAEGESPQIICQDNTRIPYPGGDVCGGVIRPVAAEFTSDGLYLLGDNGFLFYISESIVDSALAATGAVGAQSVNYVASSTIQSGVKRVLGDASDSGGCRLCDNDPLGIVSIHPSGEYLYAKSGDGALFRVDEARAIRLLSGGLASNTVQDIDADDGRVLLLFRDNSGTLTLRLFSGTDPLSESDITGACSEFSYVPGKTQSDRCRQLHPDPDLTNGGVVSQPSAELNDISLSFLERVQFIERAGGAQNDALFLWYRAGGNRHLLSIGSHPFRLKRSAPADPTAKGGAFVFGGGVAAYSSICEGGTSLCSFANLSDTTVATVGVDSVLSDHLHILNYPVGITSSGRIVYFNGLSGSNSASEISVYSPHGTTADTRRVLCGLNVDSDDEQVSFFYLSEKHEDEDMFALLGRSLDVTAGAVAEIYIVEETDSAKDQYGVSANSDESSLREAAGELTTVCGSTAYVERYRLPTGNGVGITTTGPNLDIIRLRDVVLRDVDPVPGASYRAGCSPSP